MASKGNFHYNYPRIIKWLEGHALFYNEYSDGQHLKIAGATGCIELWPARMTWHWLKSERPIDTEYHHMSFYFNPKELDGIINN